MTALLSFLTGGKMSETYRGRERRKQQVEYNGPDRRQDVRVHEILLELADVAHDLQTRSSTLVNMVEILQREVLRQEDDDDLADEQRRERLKTIETAAKEVLETPPQELDTAGLEQAIEETKAASDCIEETKAASDCIDEAKEANDE